MSSILEQVCLHKKKTHHVSIKFGVCPLDEQWCLDTRLSWIYYINAYFHCLLIKSYINPDFFVKYPHFIPDNPRQKPKSWVYIHCCEKRKVVLFDVYEPPLLTLCGSSPVLVMIILFFKAPTYATLVYEIFWWTCPRMPELISRVETWGIGLVSFCQLVFKSTESAVWSIKDRSLFGS